MRDWKWNWIRKCPTEHFAAVLYFMWWSHYLRCWMCPSEHSDVTIWLCAAKVGLGRSLSLLLYVTPASGNGQQMWPITKFKNISFPCNKSVDPSQVTQWSATGFIAPDEWLYWSKAILTLCQLICYPHRGPWDLFAVLILTGMTCDAFLKRFSWAARHKGAELREQSSLKRHTRVEQEPRAICRHDVHYATFNGVHF